MMGELERSETLPPGFPSRPATSNRRNSTKRNCAKVRKLQTPGSDFSVWLQADQPPALVFGFLPAHASRLLWRKQKVPSSLLHPVAQPNAEVASTRIRSAEVMEARRAGSIL
jgi:hypothetical protein